MHSLLSWLIGRIDSPTLQARALALTRIATGLLVVFYHGWHKIIDGLAWHTGRAPVWHFLDEVAHVGFPLPLASAWFAALAQLGGGLLVALGLFTRIGALLLVCTLLGAVYTNLSLPKEGQLA
ncbi:MAG: DoxX family membrane protein, partial [Burkholderiales bacterium]|nr:DoxX family membrane protein [Opitutaceae bacterium]